MKLKLADYEAIALALENDGQFYKRYNSATYNYTMGMRRSIISDYLWRQKRAFPSRYVNADVEDRDQLRRYFDDRYGIKTDEVNKYAHIPSVWGDEPTPEPLPPMNPALKPFVEKYVARIVSAVWFDNSVTSRQDNVAHAATALGYHCYSEQQFSQVAAAIEAACAEQSKLPVHVPGCPIPIPSPEYHAEWLASQQQPLNENPMNAPQVLIVETRTFVNGEDVAKMSDSQIFDLIAEQEKAIEKLNEIKAKPKKLTDEIAKRQAGIAALVAHLDKAA